MLKKSALGVFICIFWLSRTKGSLRHAHLPYAFQSNENAIRYNRPDSRVQISVSEKNDDVLIRVKDNGFGVPEQYRESIFQPFFRDDKSRSREHGGVGLGLALVWEIASLHGGTVKAEESAENGTAMLVSLPKNKAEI